MQYGIVGTNLSPRRFLYTDPAKLIADLERIEWWPMKPEEARQIQAEPVMHVTHALARNDHYLAVTPTEPYASRMDAIREHRLHERDRDRGDPRIPRPSSPRRAGDLTAQFLLADAESYASAVRTARAGGEGWGLNGPEA